MRSRSLAVALAVVAWTLPGCPSKKDDAKPTPAPVPSPLPLPLPLPTPSASVEPIASALPTEVDAAADASHAPEGAISVPADAPFRELVKAIQKNPTSKVGRGCLFSGGRAGAPLALEVPVTLGRDTIPDPPEDLDAILTAPKHGAVRLWSTWGETEGGDLLDLVALTPISKAARNTMVAVLALTDKGTYFLALGMPSDGHVASTAEVTRLKSEIVPKAKLWVVTAEAGVPVSRLRDALEDIDATKGSVVLATPARSSLGPKRKLSRYDAKVAAGQPDACDKEMQGGVAGAQAGEFSTDQMLRAAEALDPIPAQCGAALAAGAGGSIFVMTRVTTDGSIGKACAETDDTGAPLLRSCAIAAVRKTKLEPPARPGIVPFGTSILFFGKTIPPLCP